MQRYSFMLCSCLLVAFAVAMADAQEKDDPHERPMIEHARARRRAFDPSDLPPKVAAAAHVLLTEKFGNDDGPRFWDILPVEYGAAEARFGRATGWRLAHGANVYAEHCAACHGSQGDGAGWQAAKLSVKPRDFRQGIFKWTSTLDYTPPSRHDLRETLWLGVPGTPMKSFQSLSTQEMEAVVED